jgi:hypothetical protein
MKLLGFAKSKSVFEFKKTVSGHSFNVPKKSGIYVIVYEGAGMPKFKSTGTGPRMYRDRFVNISIKKLKNKWVNFNGKKDKIVYIGKAGPSKNRTLNRRIKEYIKFGSGKEANHYGGRYVWQIAEQGRLAVCWKISKNPGEEEKMMLKNFKEEHGGRLPFANIKS